MIFISHSSQDNSFADSLRSQLDKRKFESIFLDFHPEQGIPAGRNWEQELGITYFRIAPSLPIGNPYLRKEATPTFLLIQSYIFYEAVN